MLTIVFILLIVLILAVFLILVNRRDKKQLHTNMPDAVQENKMEEQRRRRKT